MPNFPIQMERFSSAVDQQIGTRFAAKNTTASTPSQGNGWSLPPWTAHPQRGGRMPFAQKNQPGSSGSSYEIAFYKRSIPVVTLCLDQMGRNITIESTDDNNYVKIPESNISVHAIIRWKNKKECRGLTWTEKKGERCSTLGTEGAYASVECYAYMPV